jgi:hypothetical protein
LQGARLRERTKTIEEIQRVAPKSGSSSRRYGTARSMRRATVGAASRLRVYASVSW